MWSKFQGQQDWVFGRLGFQKGSREDSIFENLVFFLSGKKTRPSKMESSRDPFWNPSLPKT